LVGVVDVTTGCESGPTEALLNGGGPLDTFALTGEFVVTIGCNVTGCELGPTEPRNGGGPRTAVCAAVGVEAD
jgi:hypothetical protein